GGEDADRTFDETAGARDQREGEGRSRRKQGGGAGDVDQDQRRDAAIQVGCRIETEQGGRDVGRDADVDGQASGVVADAAPDQQYDGGDHINNGNGAGEQQIVDRDQLVA